MSTGKWVAIMLTVYLAVVIFIQTLVHYDLPTYMASVLIGASVAWGS